MTVDIYEHLHKRITELEAALDSMTIERGEAQAERDEILHDKHDRIAELEAERDRLKETLLEALVSLTNNNIGKVFTLIRAAAEK
jgi:uncharacterized protein Yka (UPF0111/DUF47 family)